MEAFPTLFGFDKNGKLKQWDIYVTKHNEYSEVVYSHGLVNGKPTINRLVVDKGKNIGKKNETTHFQQAVMDAQSKWNKKRDTDGYSTTREPEQFAQLMPMLAHDYKKNIKKVTFPCYVQPKLDGYRMIYDPNTPQHKMTTRTGREYNVLNDTIMHEELKRTGLALDGELYVHDSNFVFEDYGFLRRHTSTNPNDVQKMEKIEYHVYDVIDTGLTFSERFKVLQRLFEQQTFTKLKLVPTIQCSNELDVTSNHITFTTSGYEGTMIRNASGVYRCKYRSHDLLKYKDFDDAEFPIVDVASEADTKGNEPLIVWVCETNGRRFNVRPQGTETERKYLYTIGQSFIGKKLWVKFQGYTDNGVVRFPSTMRATYSEYIRGNVE